MRFTLNGVTRKVGALLYMLIIDLTKIIDSKSMCIENIYECVTVEINIPKIKKRNNLLYI